MIYPISYLLTLISSFQHRWMGVKCLLSSVDCRVTIRLSATEPAESGEAAHQGAEESPAEGDQHRGGLLRGGARTRVQVPQALCAPLRTGESGRLAGSAAGTGNKSVDVSFVVRCRPVVAVPKRLLHG